MDIFNSNISYTNRNGLNTNLWKDRWIHNQSLRTMLVGPLPIEELSKPVSSIISYSNGNPHWNLDTIPFPIPTKISLAIINIITLPLNPSNSSDSSFWSLTSNGIFNLKSAYIYINKSIQIQIILT